MNKQEDPILSKFGNDPHKLAKTLREFSKSAEMLSSASPRLIERYPMQWIGVFRGEVSAKATSLETLISKLKKRGIPLGETIVRFVERDQRKLIL